MDLQVLGSGKVLVTSRKWAGKWFLPGVDSHMVDQLVLGLEWFLLSRTVLPVAGVVCDLWTSDVILCQMGHDLVQVVENFVAHFLGVLINPLTSHLLLDVLSEVLSVVGVDISVHVSSHVPVVVGLTCSSGCEGVMEAGIHGGVVCCGAAAHGVHVQRSSKQIRGHVGLHGGCCHTSSCQAIARLRISGMSSFHFQ